MIQLVRRHDTSSAGKTSLPTHKIRRLKVAFVALASANLFVIASVAAFYFLSHHQ